MNLLSKILRYMIFPTLLALIFYIAFKVDYEQPYNITLIEINGCKHWTSEKYFEYAGLDNKDNYETLTLPIIKSRLEKHPYVKRADVLYSGNGKVEVYIAEKEFWAVLIASGKEFILTKNFELLPVLKFTQQMYVPVISNLENFTALKEFENVKENKTLKPIYKLLEAAKMINPSLYDNLSEIALEKNDDVSLYFTFADYELKMKRTRAVEELYYFNVLWKYINGSEITENLDYIDLRFNGKIFLGMDENIDEGSKT